MKVMQFRVGEEVEVFYVGGEVGGWIPATVLKVDESEYYEVETRTQLEINRMKMRVGRDKIRPWPSPEDDQNDRIFEEGQVVEILNYDLWITGMVWEVHHHGTAGTNNISYSVFFVSPFLNNYPRRYKVSRSQIRVRRQWVDGEWVPTPPLRLHNQQGLFIPSIKSRDFSSGLKDHSTIERRSEERTTLLQLRDSGAEVEVFEDFMNKWICATIKELQGNQIRVQYNVWSWVKNSSHEIDKFYDMSRVRSPLPPKIKDGKISLNLHQVIEVWDSDYLTYSDGWSLGEVLEIGYVMNDSNRIYYCVSHPSLGYINVEETEIRICQKWENGQRFQPSSALNMAPPLKRRKMEDAHSLIGAEVEVYSFYHNGWITVTKLGSVGNQIEVEAKIRRKLWRITVDACRIRSRPAAERENNRIFKENEVVEVRLFDSNVWKKGEIWEVHHGTSWNNLFYTIKVVDYLYEVVIHKVSKSQVRVRQKWMEENWTDSCIEQIRSLTKVVDEQHNVPFLNPAEVGISNAIRPIIGGSSSINRKARAKTDITWEHCKILDLPNRKWKVLQCNYCEQIYKGGGINRMKQHLGHQEKGDATPCQKVPESVRDQIQNDLNMVSAGKKVKPGNASKKIQDKQV
ncbi:protein AGENET DOMAIN (AGD)-CONTAINING P1-like [Macadamia integrifolia]|uniref:protein AGENET DOMAIN (AGD)-CONTAINING P1-like n=1 Tax=Macadamia integrifolia TaxID=60698 RepID=UPI001C4F3948|nr:protein AGENET DOMAIN (AGD)-CONTAINING P1-like [Macadamia integrifolia]